MSIISAISLLLIPFQAGPARPEQQSIPEESPSSQGQYSCIDYDHENRWDEAWADAFEQYAQYARDNCQVENLSDARIREILEREINGEIFRNQSIAGGRSLGFEFNQTVTPPSLDTLANFVNFTARVFDWVDFRNWVDFQGLARTVLSWRSADACQGTLLYVNRNEVCCLFDDSCDTSEVSVNQEEHDAGIDGAVEDVSVPEAGAVDAAAEREDGVIQDVDGDQGDVAPVVDPERERAEAVLTRQEALTRECIRGLRSMEMRSEAARLQRLLDQEHEDSVSGIRQRAGRLRRARDDAWNDGFHAARTRLQEAGTDVSGIRCP